MGLDQYLHAKKYHSGMGFYGAEEVAAYKEIMAAVADIAPFADDQLPSAVVEVKVAYWRKQNAIHNWFVKYCQDGNDDCRDYHVTRDQLAELRDTCQKVLDNPALAPQLLPTTAGFFFGSTDYDGWYRNGLEYTATTISKLLTAPESWNFYYQSSW